LTVHNYIYVAFVFLCDQSCTRSHFCIPYQ